MGIPEICPKGHVGRGILLSSERVVCAEGSPAFVDKFECEMCDEVWFEDGCQEDFSFEFYDEPSDDQAATQDEV